jgi:hypothetical protein
MICLDTDIAISRRGSRYFRSTRKPPTLRG